MAFLASDVMTDSAALLNDTALTNFTYVVQLPFLKLANKELEQLLLLFDSSIQRVATAAIDVAALSLTLTLPSDFLLPIRLFERDDGATNADWKEMVEKRWEPESIVQTTSLVYWCFRNNGIYFVGSTNAKEVKLEYERRIAAISVSTSPEENVLAENFLAARTAEMCARQIGMNETVADSIRDNYTNAARNNLMQALTLNQQGMRVRRRRFRTKTLEVW